MGGEANIWQPRELLQLSADTKRIEEKLTATAGQTLFTLQNFTYVVDTGSLAVYLLTAADVALGVKGGRLLKEGVDWAEGTISTFSLTIALAAGDQITAVGYVAITGTVDIRDTDIFISNYQDIRDYAGTEITLYSQGKVTHADEGEDFFGKITGAAPGFYVDNNDNIIVPTGGDGSIAWIRRVTENQKLSPLTVAVMKADVRFSTADIGRSVPKTKEFDTGEGGSGAYDIIAGTGTATGRKIIAHDTAPISFVLREENTMSLAQLSVVGDGSDETAKLDGAIADFNASTSIKLIGAEGKLYKYNGVGLKVTSDKTVDMQYGVFITDSATLCWLTEGTFSAHSENIRFKKINTLGFADPIMLLFADESTISESVSLDCANIGIQVKGDDLVGNVVYRNKVVNPGFHCYASNDSVDFDPAHVDQGLRYPKDTTFRDNIAEDAGALAYNTHSNSNGGMSRVYGGSVINCNQFGKNSYGSQIWKDIRVVKDTGIAGSTWVFQLGAALGVTPENAMTTMENCYIETDIAESLFLFNGNCRFINNDIVYKGTADARLPLYQLNKGANLIEISGNTLNGNAIQPQSNGLIADNIPATEIIKKLIFKDNEFDIVIRMASTSESIFEFNGEEIEHIVIDDNDFEVDPASLAGNFVELTSFTSDRVDITDNTLKGKVLKINPSSGCLVDTMNVTNNINLEQTNFRPDRVITQWWEGNTPSKTPLDVPGTDSGSAKTIIANFVAGEEYRIRISTDRNNTSGTGFLTASLYHLMISRDGLSLLAATQTLIGSEANLTPVFAIAGSDISYYMAFAQNVYIDVKRVGGR